MISFSRTALDVAVDLEESLNESEALIEEQPALRGERKKEFNSEELIAAGLNTRSQRAEFQRNLYRIPVLSAVIIGCLALLVSGGKPGLGLVGFFMGLSGGYIVARRKLFLRKQQYLRDIDYFLPIVMERLVMAVQAGLDVFSSFRVLNDLNEDEGEDIDPVSRLFQQVYSLTERGVVFEEALKQVGDSVTSPSLKHAFVHLAVAQKEGGELIHPLRELSDSTQTYFQEKIEEEIAQLPVKATMPLLLTFAGLIIFFLTSPVIQVMKLSAEMVPK